jgi:hypothetical protein
MITKQDAVVFYAPTAGRRYFTKPAAINAEAKAKINKKYPAEEYETDENGNMTYGGFHWSEMERADVMLRRLSRIIKRCT